jgi:ribosomal protein S13
MVRIGNKEVPDNKNILVAQEIVSDTKIEYTKKIRNLNLEEIKSINEKIKQFPTEEELKRKIQKNISEQIRLGTYQRMRRSRSKNSA